MGRSLKKGPYVDLKLVKKIHKLSESGKNSPIKTWSRGSMIVPEFVDIHLMFTMEKFLFQFCY